MRCDKRNDEVIMKAIDAQNNGHWTQASRLFQQAGNQYRNPDDKQRLWDAAKQAQRIAQID